MASIKNLKKDIKSLCESVQNECYVELVFGTSNEVEFIWSIMMRCEKLEHETLKKINSKESNKLPKKEKKKYFNSLMDDFYNQTMIFIKDLNSVIP